MKSREEESREKILKGQKGLITKQETELHSVSQKSRELRKRTSSIPGRVPFPRDSLKTALTIPTAIWKDNAGDPFDPILLAKSLGTTSRSSAFERLVKSSERYGLSMGGEKARAISLTELGRAIVAPTDEELLGINLRRALLTPKVFEQFYTRYDRKNLPKEEIIKTVLEREFGIPRPDVDSCYSILMENIADHDLSLRSGDSNLLYLDNLGKVAINDEAKESIIRPQGMTEPQPAFEPQPPSGFQEHIARVFISHSKNRKILDQIKQMLEFGKFEHRVAEEKETPAIPISDKVFGMMLECNCGIINISADAETELSPPQINQNVLIEIGGAFLHYSKRVILVIDKKLKDQLPSILHGLTAIFYEGDQLSWNDGMRLQRALTEFRSSL